MTEREPQPRLEPLADEHWPEELAAVLAGLGAPLNVHRVMAWHPELLQAWMPFRDFIVSGSALSPRQRELIILRHAHDSRTAYEWHHHVQRGRAAGIDEADIDRIRAGPDAGGWREEEALLLQAVDELHRERGLSDVTWSALSRQFSVQQCLELLCTVGMYETLATIINSLRVPLEDAER